MDNLLEADPLGLLANNEPKLEELDEWMTFEQPPCILLTPSGGDGDDGPPMLEPQLPPPMEVRDGETMEMPLLTCEGDNDHGWMEIDCDPPQVVNLLSHDVPTIGCRIMTSKGTQTSIDCIGDYQKVSKAILIWASPIDKRISMFGHDVQNELICFLNSVVDKLDRCHKPLHSGLVNEVLFETVLNVQHPE